MNCPSCSEEIQDTAVKCKHCGEAVVGKAGWKFSLYGGASLTLGSPSLRVLLRDTGLLQEFDADTNEARVESKLWRGLNIDGKRAVAAELADRCDVRGREGRVTVLDHRSKKKLATFSRSGGWTSYE